MKHTFRYTITEKTEYQTAEQFLHSIGYSRKLLIHLKKSTYGITVDGEPIYTNRQIEHGEVLTVTLEEKESSDQILPVELPLNIVYEDEHLMVINKNANVPIPPLSGKL